MILSLIPKYPVPSNCFAATRTGVDTSSLVLYSVYVKEGAHSEAAVKVIEGQVVGAFHGKVKTHLG